MLNLAVIPLNLQIFLKNWKKATGGGSFVKGVVEEGMGGGI